MFAMYPPTALLLALFSQVSSTDCLSLNAYLQSMRQFPLRNVQLLTPEGKKAGHLVRLDFNASPPVLELRGANRNAMNRLCIQRDAVEKLVVYRIVRLEHDFDGTACVTYEEGKPHSRLFQRMPHNRGKELQLHPYRERKGRWSRVRAQSGFSHEALKFECGIQVGQAQLLALLEDGAASDGHLVVRADSPWARKGFEELSSFEWKGVRYLIGSGLAID